MGVLGDLALGRERKGLLKGCGGEIDGGKGRIEDGELSKSEREEEAVRFPSQRPLCPALHHGRKYAREGSDGAHGGMEEGGWKGRV
jgi:hypothetical protein